MCGLHLDPDSNKQTIENKNHGIYEMTRMLTGYVVNQGRAANFLGMIMVL